MEEIYMNVKNDKSVHSRPSTNQTGPSSSERRFYRAVVLCLGLLSVFLLTLLFSLMVNYRTTMHSAATIKANMKNKLNSLTKERDQLNAKLSSLTKERDQLNVRTYLLTEERGYLNVRLSSLTAEKDQLNTRLSTLTAEKDQLNATLSSLTVEKGRLEGLCRQNKTCPAGWTMFSCSCYFFSSESGSWTKGREDCRKTGADLVVIDSAEEQRFLSGLTKVSTWIGLTDREEEGTWKWIDGTSLTLRYWRIKQPDNGDRNPRLGEEDCGHIGTDKNIEENWNDLSCDGSLSWICEKMA